MPTRVLTYLFEISSTGPVELDVVVEYAVVRITCPSGMTAFLCSRTNIDMSSCIHPPVAGQALLPDCASADYHW
jgi:hypothetical protein